MADLNARIAHYAVLSLICLLAGYSIYNGLYTDLQNPVVTNIEVVGTAALPFPAVTVSADEGAPRPREFQRKVLDQVLFACKEEEEVMK